MMKRFLISFVAVFCLAGIVRGDLAKRIDSVLSQPSQRKVQFSIHVVKADSGREIYSYNADQALVPASNMKLMSSAAALRYLGKDFEYKTQVGLCGNALVIIGSGDPLLGDKVTDEKYGRKPGWIIDDICQKLRQQQITDINNIVVDTSVFDDQRVHPSWEPAELNKSYAAEICGLNYNCNFIEMTVENIGGKAVISIEPKSSFLKTHNQVKIISSKRGSVGAYRRPGEINVVDVKGTCRTKQGPFEVAIERPAAYFGFVLAERLAAEGIRVNGQLLEQRIDEDCDFKLLSEYKTSFADCLTRCHKDSLNLAAEAMLKTVGRKVCNDGSWAGGRSAIEKYLRSLSISEDEFKIDDGCGLSKENKISSNCITTVLKDSYDSKGWDFYKQTLAVAGTDGTIRKYFKEEKYKGRILAKTGYITSVRALSGVCCTKSGDYLFSILTNTSHDRKALNDIAKAIIDEFDN